MSVETNTGLCPQLPGDVWRVTYENNGVSVTKFSLAHRAITSSVNQAVQQRLLPKRAAHFVESSLHSALMTQSLRNDAISGIHVPPVEHELWESYLEGTAAPNELVKLRRELGARANGMGIEVARAPHVGIWDTEDIIDAPVRNAQVNDPSLGTRLVEGHPYYKVKFADADGRIVERKRRVATHFGDPEAQEEELWTVRRDMYFVDFIAIEGVLKTNPKQAPTRIAYQSAEEIQDVLQGASLDPSKRNALVRSVVEPIVNLPIDLRPRYIRPLDTNVYVKEPKRGTAD